MAQARAPKTVEPARERGAVRARRATFATGRARARVRHVEEEARSMSNRIVRRITLLDYD